LFVGAGLLVGHLLGGPAPEDRTVLGLATACRHPGLAAALAGAVAPDQKLIVAAVVMTAMVGAIATIPYVKARKKAVSAPTAA
jgi:bile acid:Na+ symporter, BASS family